jgi:hypothetical protein
MRCLRRKTTLRAGGDAIRAAAHSGRQKGKALGKIDLRSVREAWQRLHEWTRIMPISPLLRGFL